MRDSEKLRQFLGKTPLFLILWLTFGFYLTFISRTMQYDEAYTFHHFAVNPVIALFSYTEPNNHMLHSLLVWVSTTFAGTSQLAIRFPALAMALLSIAMIYRVGCRIGGQSLGIAAAVFLATNWTFSDYAVNARGYTLSVFLTLVLIELVFLTKPKRARSYRYALLGTCAGLIITLPTLVILIAGCFGWVFWKGRRQPRYRSAAGVMMLGSVIGAMFYLPSVIYGSAARSLGRFGYNDLGVFFGEWGSEFFGAPLFGILTLLFCAFGLVMLWRQPGQRLRAVSLCAVGSALLVILVQYALLSRTFYGRNFLYLLPVICLIAGFGVNAVFGKRTVYVALPMMLVAGVLLQPFLSRQTNVDELLAFFDTRLQPDDMVLVGNFADEPMFYHLRMRDQWDRLRLTPEKERLMVAMQDDNELTTLLDVYSLTPYASDCRLSTEYVYSFAVYECDLSQPPQ